MMQLMWACAYLFEILISILLDKYPEVELLGPVIVPFSFLRNLHTVFYSSWTILRSYLLYVRVHISLHPHQHLSLVFLVISILTSVRWYLVVFCCTSQTINDVEHFFMYLLTISVSLEKCQSPLPMFWYWSCVFFFPLLLSCRRSLSILDINTLSVMWFVSISSHSISVLFVLLLIVLAVLKLFRLT